MIVRTLCALLALTVPALADSGQSGVWTWTGDAPADGRGFVTALSPAPGASYNDPSYMIARCLGGRTEFLVGTQGGWGLSGQQLEVTTQIDGKPAANAKWDVSSNGKAVFVDDQVEAFLRAIPDAGKFHITVKDPTGAAHENIFSTTGFGEVRDKISKACGWAP